MTAPLTAAFDLKAAGSGFIYALEVRRQFIISRTCVMVLVIGAEKLSAMVDWQDRDTCFLFGDGAGAVVLRARPASHGLLTTCLGNNGDRAGLLFTLCNLGCGLHRVNAGWWQSSPGQRAISRGARALPAHGRSGDVQAGRPRHAQRRARSVGSVRSATLANQVRHPAPGQPAHH